MAQRNTSAKASDPPAPAPRRWRRFIKRAFLVITLGAIAHTVAWTVGVTKLTTPFDVAFSLLPTQRHANLDAPDDGNRHLVVLLHGVGRSAWSVWKIERLLKAHGYEVWNETYDGHGMGLIALGEDLGKRLDAFLGGGAGDRKPAKLYGVAHSMGGLVLRSYLARPDARPFERMAFLGTPNQGAVLADQLHGRWYYRLVLGAHAAQDLAPSRGVVKALGGAPRGLGNVIGGKLDGAGYSASIPGDDDSKVGVDEAHLEGEADAVRVAASHLFLTVDDGAHYQALHFLRHQRFDHAPSK